MQHVLIVNSKNSSMTTLLRYARELDLDINRFCLCLDRGKYDDAVMRNSTHATQVGINGTPQFLLGPTVKDGHFRGIKIVGARPFGVFKQKIRREGG
jgi:predicted DsbA family dithiol-disulfide isomerase